MLSLAGGWILSSLRLQKNPTNKILKYSTTKVVIYTIDESAIGFVKGGVVIAWCPRQFVVLFSLFDFLHCKRHRSTDLSNHAPRLHLLYKQSTSCSFLSTRNIFYAMRGRPLPLFAATNLKKKVDGIENKKSKIFLVRWQGPIFLKWVWNPDVFLHPI